MRTTERSRRYRCRYALSGSDIHCNRQGDLSSRETSPTSSQSLRATAQTLAEQRHSWRETPFEAHRATRETVENASQSHHRQTDHRRASTRTHWTRTVDRYSRANEAEKAQAQEEWQRL